MHEDSWSLLLARVASEKNAEAYQALFNHFAPRLKSRLMKMGAPSLTAEDVVQETFITVWRKADGFDAGKGSAAAWIFTVARNKHIDRIRKDSRPEPDLNDPTFLKETECDSSDSVDAGQRAQFIRQAISKLPEAQKAVLLRSYYDEQTHAEIADSLKLPIGTVKSRIRLALEKLHGLIPQHFKDDL